MESHYQQPISQDSLTVSTFFLYGVFRRVGLQWGQYPDPKNLSQALGIEAAELQEIFLWKTFHEFQKK